MIKSPTRSKGHIDPFMVGWLTAGATSREDFPNLDEGEAGQLLQKLTE